MEDYVGIDVGAKSVVVCVWRTGRLVSTTTFAQTPAGHRALIDHGRLLPGFGPGVLSGRLQEIPSILLLRVLLIVDTINGMEIEFDSDKDVTNLAKHGISLSAASGFDMDTALVALDDREDYGEDRWIAIGFIKASLHVLIRGAR